MLLSTRGDKGLRFIHGPKNKCQEYEGFTPDTSKNCRSMCFSPNGQRFAWCNGESVLLAEIEADGKWTTRWKSDIAKRTVYIEFSPLNNFLATWEVYAVRTGETAAPNLRIWNAANGFLIKEFIQRKADGWCPQWSQDEKICCVRGANNEAFFYTNSDFSQPTTRLSLPKMGSFSMSPVGVSVDKIHHVVAFVPGQKGGPGFAKLFAYPNFNPDKNVLANKSFFNVDEMAAHWSQDGRSVLLLCQSEVDKTGASYYGKTQLYYVDIGGETSMIQLPKDGPVYHLCWSPTKPEFCVVYGFMPAKATLFNKKCDPIFDFGTGPRNVALFNQQGTILMLGGFGNLRGVIEMWDVDKKKEITKFEAPDSTDIKWSPCGQYIVASTCAPRLRQGNGYQVWHYTSTLMHETMLKEKEELWEVKWQSSPLEKNPPFPILNKPIGGGIVPSQPVASKQAYRPPGARGIVSNFKLHDEDELPQNKKKEGAGDALSKSALKNKKRREKKKEGENEPASNGQPESKAPVGSQPAAAPVDPEVAKKVRKLNEKLAQISKLKAQQDEGKKLEVNQLEKIKKEKEIIDELRALRLAS